MEFELAYYDFAVQSISHYTMEASIISKMDGWKKLERKRKAIERDLAN